MGVRRGQGFNAPKPKRARCPDCGKKGVTQWRVTPHGLLRGCQYCQSSWGEAGWAAAMAKRPGCARCGDTGRVEYGVLCPTECQAAVRAAIAKATGSQQ